QLLVRITVEPADGGLLVLEPRKDGLFPAWRPRRLDAEHARRSLQRRHEIWTARWRLRQRGHRTGDHHTGEDAGDDEVNTKPVTKKSDGGVGHVASVMPTNGPRMCRTSCGGIMTSGIYPQDGRAGYNEPRGRLLVADGARRPQARSSLGHRRELRHM